MSERTTITQITQIGTEVTPGTAVAVTKRLQAVQIAPSIQAEVQTYRPSGGKFHTIGALGKEWTEASISGPATYTDLVYLLASVMSYTAPTLVGAAKAYEWEFDVAHSAEDTIKTFSVEHGSAYRAGKFSHGVVSELGLNFSRESVEVSGTMLGQRYSDGVALTSSGVADVALQPILPTEVTVYLDDTWAALGTTKLARAFKADFNLSNRFAPLWPLDASVTSFATVVETAPDASIKLLVEADAAGMGPLAAMRSGAKKFIRIEAVGPLIETGSNYKLTLDMCGLVSEIGEFADEDGVYAVEWTLTAAYDSVGTAALEVTIINELTAL